MLKIIFNRKKCIGCGYCQNLAPQFWKTNSLDGKVNLLNISYLANAPEIFPDDLNLLIQSELACPVKAIKINL